MDLTNYIYFTVYFTYLLKNMSMSFTRSIDSGESASLSEVSAFAQYHVNDYATEGGESPLTGIAGVIAARIPQLAGGVTGVRALAYREGAVSPVVYASTRGIPGQVPVNVTAQLPTFVSVSFSAKTFAYRRNGPRFSLPLMDEALTSGNTVNVTFDQSVWGTVYPGPGSSLLDLLNTDAGWNDTFGSFSRKSVVKRVPNTAPEGSGTGDRLPTFIVDPVSAVLTSDYTYNRLVRTQKSREF